VNNEGLVLLVAWTGWFALLASLFVTVLRRGRRP
jgi:hypothetical protein